MSSRPRAGRDGTSQGRAGLRWPALLLADPALVRLGGLELRWSGALLALGLALGYLAVRAAGARRGLSPRALRDAALWCLPEALLAARGAHVIGHPEIYITTPARVVQVWDGGFSFGAGLLVGAWALARHARRQRLPAARLLDAAVPGLLIAQGLAALGRAADALTVSAAPLPPWDRPLPAPSGSSVVVAPPLLGGDTFVVAPLATAVGALALLVAYAALARGRAPGLLFRVYLLLQAVGQVALHLTTGQAAPDTLGIVAWAAVAVAAALSALYHLRVRSAAPSRAECRDAG